MLLLSRRRRQQQQRWAQRQDLPGQRQAGQVPLQNAARSRWQVLYQVLSQNTTKLHDRMLSL